MQVYTVLVLNLESLSCVRQQAFAPFPYILFSMGLMCLICSSFEEDDFEKMLEARGYKHFKLEGKKK